MSSETVLVTGASGHFGGAVLSYLIDSLGVAPGRIIATTRRPASLQALAERGVQVRAADFDDPKSLDGAFAGAGGLLLVSADVPGRRLAQHRAAIDAAARAGVDHLLYTSMPKADTTRVSLAKDHYPTEQAIAATGIPFTILRNNWYFENLLHSLPPAIASGSWYSSAADGRIAYLSRADCARVAATLLAQGASGSRFVDVTGETSYTTEEIAAAVNQALGKTLRVVHVTDEQLEQGLLAAGLPPPIASLFTEFDAITRAGDLGGIADTVRRVTGRAPDTLADFLQRNAQALTAPAQP